MIEARRRARGHGYVEDPANGRDAEEPRRPSPVLYLRGNSPSISRRPSRLARQDALNLSAAVIARLKNEWEDEYRRWQKRDLSARHYVYVWADGVYLQARMERQAECMLVLMGATAEG